MRIALWIVALICLGLLMRFTQRADLGLAILFVASTVRLIEAIAERFGRR